MPCEERKTLLENLAAAARAHTSSLRSMNALNRWEFDKAWDAAEALRLKKDLAQQTLTEHDRQHRCLEITKTAIAARTGSTDG
jgi:hypothetical protein